MDSTEAHGEICETDPCQICEAISSGLEAVAQTLVNISEGHTTIEDGSPLFAGMSRLMRPQVAYPLRAAPDLLAALEATVGYLPPTQQTIARAAIAKARGKS